MPSPSPSACVNPAQHVTNGAKAREIIDGVSDRTRSVTGTTNYLRADRPDVQNSHFAEKK
eukprot:scaffold12059_cov136-Skeletonema_dohrnii-CCMP3373.AAC.3